MLLPYADQRALEIGITIAGGADVILLDEPTSGMSRSETERTVELIRSISKDKTVVVVEHDMGVVFRSGRTDFGTGLRRNYCLGYPGKYSLQPKRPGSLSGNGFLRTGIKRLL